MAEQDAARPRLRLNRAQWVLAGVLGLLLLALVVLSFQASAQQREHTESLARTEAENTNAAFTLRETLTYIDTAERYLLGVAPAARFRWPAPCWASAWTSSAPTVSPPDRPRPRNTRPPCATWMRRSSNCRPASSRTSSANPRRTCCYPRRGR